MKAKWLHDPRWQLSLLGLLMALSLLFMGGGWAILATEIIIMALYASSLNLLISYSGMVSFGHAAYFGLGAYGFALSVQKLGFPPGVALLIGPAVSMMAAMLYGALCVRLSRIYFAMLTLACSEITYTILFQAYDYTGGDTGITSFMTPRFGLGQREFALVALAVVAASLGLLWRIVNSSLGLVMQSVGEEPHRAAALGYNPRLVQWISFVIAGTFAGVAGTLFVVYQGNAFPDYASISFTLDALVMVVIGGLRSFTGGVLGAVVYTLLKTFATRTMGSSQLFVGAVLLGVVLLAPAGLAGVMKRLRPASSAGKS